MEHTRILAVTAIICALAGLSVSPNTDTKFLEDVCGSSVETKFDSPHKQPTWVLGKKKVNNAFPTVDVTFTANCKEKEIVQCWVHDKEDKLKVVTLTTPTGRQRTWKDETSVAFYLFGEPEKAGEDECRLRCRPKTTPSVVCAKPYIL